MRDVGLPPGWMDHVVYGFVTPATLAALGAPASFNELQIVVRDASADRDAVRRIAYDVKALVERNGAHVTDVDVPVPGQHRARGADGFADADAGRVRPADAARVAAS